MSAAVVVDELVLGAAVVVDELPAPRSLRVSHEPISLGSSVACSGDILAWKH